MHKPRIISISSSDDPGSEGALPYEELLKERDELKEKCIALEHETAILHSMLEQLDNVADVSMTAEQADEFSQELKETLTKMSYSEACSFYTRERILTFPVAIRYLMSVALANYCQQLSKPIMDVWSEVITKQGAI